MEISSIAHYQFIVCSFWHLRGKTNGLFSFCAGRRVKLSQIVMLWKIKTTTFNCPVIKSFFFRKEDKRYFRESFSQLFVLFFLKCKTVSKENLFLFFSNMHKTFFWIWKKIYCFTLKPAFSKKTTFEWK